MGTHIFSSADKLILLVDDDRGIRELLDVLLKREGFRVATAEDGTEALRKAREVLPDLILLDLMLPGANGLEIVRELQQDETATIPIVIMTGRAMDHSTSDMFRREPNVRDYLEKPVKLHSLTALLHRLLNTRPPVRKSAP